VHCADVLKSIKNFAGITHALNTHQSDELRVTRRVRKYSRELDRKSRMLRQGASRRGGGAALGALWCMVGVDGRSHAALGQAAAAGAGKGYG
jgi:hypothetical protein